MSSKKSSQSSISTLLWKLLPWLLLLAMIAAFAWVYMSFNSERLERQNVWQPPRNENTQANITEQQPDINKPVPLSSYHDAVASASHSVVNIYTTQTVIHNPYMDDPILRRFYEFHGGLPQQEQNSTNLGSGVIVSEDGYIVTNAHVIAKADEIVVAFNDGKKSIATVVGTDPDSDLAVIRVDETGLKPLAFREEPIRVGDVALAIGNPFGVGQTVTQGIISATGRTGLGINTFEDFLQTDAAINPGNSGGALVDANGELIGINTAIFTRSGGSMGIGFAIPTSLVEQVMNAIIQHGKVSRGWLGIEVSSQLRDPTRLDSSTGVQILNVVPNSPAEQGGLQVGDLILSIDGVEMTDANRLIQYVARQMPDAVLTTQVLRGETNMIINVRLGERPTQNDRPIGIPIPQELIPNERQEPNQGDGYGRGGEPNSSQRSLSPEERARLSEELIELYERQQELLK